MAGAVDHSVGGFVQFTDRNQTAALRVSEKKKQPKKTTSSLPHKAGGNFVAPLTS